MMLLLLIILKNFAIVELERIGRTKSVSTEKWPKTIQIAYNTISFERWNGNYAETCATAIFSSVSVVTSQFAIVRFDSICRHNNNNE